MDRRNETAPVQPTIRDYNLGRTKNEKEEAFHRSEPGLPERSEEAPASGQ